MGANEIGVMEVRPEFNLQDKVLTGYPDFVILARDTSLPGDSVPICVVTAENKSNAKPQGYSQLAFYMLQTQLKNLSLRVAKPVTGFLLSPNLFVSAYCAPILFSQEFTSQTYEEVCKMGRGLTNVTSWSVCYATTDPSCHNNGGYPNVSPFIC